MKLDVRTQMLVLLAAMVRTNPVIRGSKQLVLDHCTPIVALLSVTLHSQSGKSVPLLWKCLETNGKNEFKQIINPFPSMVFAEISYSNAKSG